MRSVVIVGAGAVGSTIGGWIAPHCQDLWMVDLPANAAVLNEKGITHYASDAPDKRETVKVRAVSDLKEVTGTPDAVILCVKNYSLDKVASGVAARFGRDVLVVGFQNGVENLKILPKHFSRVIYGIVGYNAWLDSPGVVGYQKRGPLVVGTPDGSLGTECRDLAALLSKGVETIHTEKFLDAAYSKMVVNLTNSLTTLIAHRFRPLSDPKIFQRLLTNLTYEGTQILKAAGHKEVRIGGMPPWRLMWAAAKLPQFLTRRTFEKNVKKMVVSSMAQDILQRGGKDSELDTLNGEFLRLADRHGVRAPYNRAVYRLCTERFARAGGFEPMDVTEVYREVEREARA